MYTEPKESAKSIRMKRNKESASSDSLLQVDASKVLAIGLLCSVPYMSACCAASEPRRFTKTEHSRTNDAVAIFWSV